MRTTGPPSFIISLVIPSIPWALCLFILFMALSTSSSVNSGTSAVSGLDFIVLSGVGTFGYRVIYRNLRMFLEFLLLHSR